MGGRSGGRTKGRPGEWDSGAVCRGRGARGGAQDPEGRPARAAALHSFVPPQRRGLPQVPFPARDGIDSQSQRGLGKGAGLEWKPDWEREPWRVLGRGGALGGWGVMRVRWS